MVVLGALLIPGCSPSSVVSTDVVQSDREPASVHVNSLHSVSVEFYGTFMGADDAPREELLVEKIVVTDLATQRSVDFEPVDLESLQSSFGFFERVWSPDQQFLVLPLGRFDGFAVYSAANVVEMLEAGSAPFSFSLRASATPAAMWHEFSGWRDPSIMKFRAGLGGHLVEFEIDLRTKTLSTYSVNRQGFSAHTGEGEILPIVD